MITVDELRILKDEFDDQISSTVKDFEVRTGTTVDSLEIKTSEVDTFKGRRKYSRVLSKLTFE